MESYYLPKYEREILKSQSQVIAKLLKSKRDHWNIVELGAGDGTKTAVLLKHLYQNKLSLSYTALDTSLHILKENKAKITAAIPGIEALTVEGNYSETFLPGHLLSNDQCSLPEPTKKLESCSVTFITQKQFY